MSFLPTNISGCYFWYNASVIGAANGTPITIWVDSSGSGNDLTCTVTNSSLLYFPIYNTNVINGYPAALFNGQTNYLTSSNNNSSLNNPGSGITVFSVFNTFNYAAQQGIIGVGNNLASEGLDSFFSAINIVPSSMYYAWGGGHQGGPVNIILHSLTASGNTPTYDAKGAYLIPQNNWIVRHDRFTSSGFYFGLYGADISSGIANNSVSTNNIVVMGNTAKGGAGGFLYNYPFSGYIAETIGYNRQLAINEVEQVNNYLMTKYALNNWTMPLFIYADSPATGQYKDIPLYLGTNSGLNSSIDLFIWGSGNSSSSINLYLNAGTYTSGNISLWIGNGITTNSGISLFTWGSGTLTNSTDLFIWGSGNSTYSTTLWIGNAGLSSGFISLSISGTANISSGIPLYTNCGNSQTDTTTLWIGSQILITSGLSLYMTGYQFEQLSIPLYTQASLQQFPPMTLFTWGSGFNTQSMPLWINCASGNINNIPLYTYAIDSISNTEPLPLYTWSFPPLNSTGNIPLFTSAITAGFSGLYGSTTLYTQNNGPFTSLPLFIQAEPINTNPSSFLPLFLQVATNTGYADHVVNLFMGNYTQYFTSPSKWLSIVGQGGLIGGLPYTSPMFPLYIDRPTANLMPLFICGSGQAIYSMPLSVSGVFKYSEGMDLYTYGMGISGEVPLFIQATRSMPSGISLFVSGIPNQSNYLPIHIRGF
jgi:hypothetical protein